jgi:hypothetical protein
VGLLIPVSGVDSTAFRGIEPGDLAGCSVACLESFDAERGGIDDGTHSDAAQFDCGCDYDFGIIYGD